MVHGFNTYRHTNCFEVSSAAITITADTSAIAPFAISAPSLFYHFYIRAPS
jgi:hypothetical protein